MAAHDDDVGINHTVVDNESDGGFSVFCEFVPLTGWRVRKVEQPAIAKFLIVVVDGTKLLRIPSVHSVVPGRFLNPRTNALNWHDNERLMKLKRHRVEVGMVNKS